MSGIIHGIISVASYFMPRSEESYETLLTKWENDPSITGNKAEAARRIRRVLETHNTYLDLSDLGLTHLPPLGALTELENLNVCENKFTSLPEEIGSLTKLQQLSAHHNKLTSLPGVIGFLTDLVFLDVSWNELSSLPKEIKFLTKLDNLRIVRNNLTSLPGEIRYLTALKTLCVSANKLSSLPEEIRYLTSLEKLFVGRNKLTSLPGEIRYLTRLQRLDVRENNLRSLPGEMGSLASLTELFITENSELEELPLTLGYIPGLTSLHVSGSRFLFVQRLEILRNCEARRRDRAPLDLRKRLPMWHTAACLEGKLIDITHFTEQEQAMINEWLERLEKTKDFQGNQKALASTVCGILATTKTHPEFKELFLAQVSVNNEECEDRAAMAINELYTSWKVSILPERTPLQEKLRLLVQGAKTLALHRALAEQISRHGRDQRESVEMYLFYETHLASRLHLLSLIQKSRSAADIGRRDWIDEGKLESRVKEIYLDHLIELPAFQKLAGQDPSFQAEWKSKELEFSKRLEQLEQSTQGEGVVVAEMDRIKRESDVAQRALFKKWFVSSTTRS